MEKIVDKEYCMSSFLTYRYVTDPQRIWKEGCEHREFTPVEEKDKYSCLDAKDVDIIIRKILQKYDLSKCALMLSGGIDSGILASYMPEGTKAYTVKSPAKASAIEVERAKRVCDKYHLEHIVVEVTWSDYEACIDTLMRHDGCPVFANEPQVYTLTKQMIRDGAETIILGDNADMAFGGMDRLLSREWTYDQWVHRYTFLEPKRVLQHPVDVSDAYKRYKRGEDQIDYIGFLSDIFAMSSSGAYINAFNTLEIRYVDPYAYMKMKESLDLDRVRRGESKYILRDLYRNKFPEFDVPEKIAMARAVDVWLKDWKGPIRKEFKENCIEGLTGEQKFLVYSLERFLNLMDIAE